MGTQIKISLSYFGRSADGHILNFYDASTALKGFQRSLALTAHLVLNNEIITQAPSLKGAEIFLLPPEEGSWKATAVIVLAGIWYGGTASPDTPVGNLISSAYDYVLNETMGFHIDYSKTIQEQYENYKKAHPHTPDLHQGRFDNLVEKCVPAVIDMHRPIVVSESAKSAKLLYEKGGASQQLGHDLNIATWEYANYNIESDSAQRYCGTFTSYNATAFSGRLFLPEERRPITFHLTEDARTLDEIDEVTRSLVKHTRQKTYHTKDSEICVIAFTVKSKTGRLKKLTVIDVLTE